MEEQNEDKQPWQDAYIRPETVRAKAYFPRPTIGGHAVTVSKATATLEIIKPPTTTRTLRLEITGLINDSEYKLYDGDSGHLIDYGIGDDIVDAFMAMGIRLADGPDPSVPDN